MSETKTWRQWMDVLGEHIWLPWSVREGGPEKLARMLQGGQDLIELRDKRVEALEAALRGALAVAESYISDGVAPREIEDTVARELGPHRKVLDGEGPR